MNDFRNSQKPNYLFPIIIIGVLFFIFGFVTWLNGILIPFLGIACELSNFQAFFVTFAFYISYLVMAIPSSYVLKKTGLKNGISWGLITMAFGALVFIPAALSREFTLFLTGLFIQGTGLAIMQTASNPYISILGPKESAARRISIMGISNKVAGALSPVILGAIVLKDSANLMEQASVLSGIDKINLLDTLSERVIFPYSVMAVVLLVLAAMVRFSSLPEIDAPEDEVELDSNGMETRKTIWDFPQLILGVIALFFYVGVEVLAGDSIVRFGMTLNLTPIKLGFLGDFNIANPTLFTSYTLASMIIGYILGIILIPKFITQHRMLALSAVLGIVFSFFAIVSTGFTSIIFIALLGLSNAIMWPAIWPLAIDGLGKFLKIGSSLLIMAIAGGAILPLLFGKIADASGYHNAYWVLIPCYGVILYYAVFGFKLRSWK